MQQRQFSSNEAVVGGFNSPVFDTQRVFRATMNALANPGVKQICAIHVQPPQPLPHMVAAIALCLLDTDTKTYLCGELSDHQAVRNWLSFQTGSEIVDDPLAANFVLVDAPGNLPPLVEFSSGTHEYPDRSATLIVALPERSGGADLRLTGPGIEDECKFSPRGLPNHFLQSWQSNQQRFPLGVDLIFAEPDGVTGLPRCVLVRNEED